MTRLYWTGLTTHRPDYNGLAPKLRVRGRISAQLVQFSVTPERLVVKELRFQPIVHYDGHRAQTRWASLLWFSCLRVPCSIHPCPVNRSRASLSVWKLGLASGAIPCPLPHCGCCSHLSGSSPSFFPSSFRSLVAYKWPSDTESPSWVLSLLYGLAALCLSKQLFMRAYYTVV